MGRGNGRPIRRCRHRPHPRGDADKTRPHDVRADIANRRQYVLAGAQSGTRGTAGASAARRHRTRDRRPRNARTRRHRHFAVRSGLDGTSAVQGLPRSAGAARRHDGFEKHRRVTRLRFRPALSVQPVERHGRPAARPPVHGHLGTVRAAAPSAARSESQRPNLFEPAE